MSSTIDVTVTCDHCLNEDVRCEASVSAETGHMDRPVLPKDWRRIYVKAGRTMDLCPACSTGDFKGE